MATSSITHNFFITDPKAAERFGGIRGGGETSGAGGATWKNFDRTERACRICRKNQSSVKGTGQIMMTASFDFQPPLPAWERRLLHW